MQLTISFFDGQVNRQAKRNRWWTKRIVIEPEQSKEQFSQIFGKSQAAIIKGHAKNTNWLTLAV